MVHRGRLVHDRRLCDHRRIRYNWFMVSGHVRDCRGLWLTDRSRLGDCGGIRDSGNRNLNRFGSLNRFGGVLSVTLLLHGFCVLRDAFHGWINLLNGDFFLSDDRLNLGLSARSPHAEQQVSSQQVWVGPEAEVERRVLAAAGPAQAQGGSSLGEGATTWARAISQRNGSDWAAGLSSAKRSIDTQTARICKSMEAIQP